MSEDFEDGYDGLPDDEIKACPFCGEIIYFVEDAESEYFIFTGHTEECFLGDIMVYDKDEFIGPWNRRA